MPGGRGMGDYRNTTVRCPLSRMRCSTWRRTARASTSDSVSLPSRTSSRGAIAWSTRATSCTSLMPLARSCPTTQSIHPAPNYAPYRSRDGRTGAFHWMKSGFGSAGRWPATSGSLQLPASGRHYRIATVVAPGHARRTRDGRLPEHHRAMPIEQDAVLHMAANRACQHQRFGIAAQPHQFTRCHRVVHAGHVLFDDRAFVQVLGDIVRGGADDLDPTRVCLVVRLRALKLGRKLWWMLIARPASARHSVGDRICM